MSRSPKQHSLSESPRSPNKGNLSPCSSQRHDDPFQKFFEEKDHMSKGEGLSISEGEEVTGHTFTPFEMSVVHSLLALTTVPALSLQELMTKLEWYIKPMEGGASEEYTAKMAILAEALNAGGLKNEDGDFLTTLTATNLETNPSAFTGVNLHLGLQASTMVAEYLLTNEKLTDDDHILIARKLIELDTEKDGVFNMINAFRELMRVIVPILQSKGDEDPTLAEAEGREMVRRILNTAAVNADAGYNISMSDFIELYAMEVYVIPAEYRTLDTAALTRRIDIADYSLLWAAVNGIRGVEPEHIEAALTEAAATEGVVADECSLHAIIRSVTSFIEAAAERGSSTDDALQQLADILVLNPTSLHIAVMPPEHRQEVAARKLQLYFKPSAVLSVLRALLLEDVRGDGVLSKPMAETALMVELSSSSHKAQAEAADEMGSSTVANTDEVEAYAGVDEGRVEEMIRNILLSAGVSDGSQEVSLNHFIQALIELTPVLPSRYCADVIAKFKTPAQLNELEHLQELLGKALADAGDAMTNPMGYGCITVGQLKHAIDTALVSQKGDEEGKAALVDAFKQLSLLTCSTASPAGGAFGGDAGGSSGSTTELIDLADALSVAIFETQRVTFNIASLSDYHAAMITGRRIAKGNVRTIAKAFIVLDSDRSKALTLEAFRDVMKANPKYTATEALETAFSGMDLDMDGALCFEDFLSSFNDAEYGPALSNAQLSSLTSRRMSVKELHQTGAPAATSSGRADDANASAGPSTNVVMAPGGIRPASKGGLVTALSTSAGSPTQGHFASATSPMRRSAKALSPQKDASGVPIDDGELRAEFDRYDRTGNGTLDRAEFARMYRSLENYGVEPSDREIENLFNKVCGNRGTVSYDEFCLLMLRRSRM